MEAQTARDETLKCLLHEATLSHFNPRQHITVGAHKYSLALMCTYSYQSPPPKATLTLMLSPKMAKICISLIAFPHSTPPPPHSSRLPYLMQRSDSLTHLHLGASCKTRAEGKRARERERAQRPGRYETISLQMKEPLPPHPPSRPGPLPTLIFK